MDTQTDKRTEWQTGGQAVRLMEEHPEKQTDRHIYSLDMTTYSTSTFTSSPAGLFYVYFTLANA